MSPEPEDEDAQIPDTTFLKGILGALISGTVLAGSLCGTLAYRQGTDDQEIVALLDER